MIGRTSRSVSKETDLGERDSTDVLKEGIRVSLVTGYGKGTCRLKFNGEERGVSLGERGITRNENDVKEMRSKRRER